MANIGTLLLCSVFVILVGCSAGHTLHFGRTCPDVPAYPNLSLDKVLGVWYVVFKTDTDNTCLIWNMTKSTSSEEQLFVTEKRQLSFLDVFGVDHTQSVTGTIDIPNLEIPSRLRIRWPASITGKADFVIFDTDYDNYMAVFECNRAGLVHRRSVTVVSRTSTIDDLFIRRVRRLLETAEVSHNAMDKINHDLCRKEGKHNWSLGEPDTKAGNIQRRVGDGVVDYDISEIEILGDGVSQEAIGSFRGSIRADPQQSPKV